MSRFEVEIEATGQYWTVTSTHEAEDKTAAQELAIFEASEYYGVTGWIVNSTRQLTD